MAKAELLMSLPSPIFLACILGLSMLYYNNGMLEYNIKEHKVQERMKK
jgi:hypothetical protein